MNSYLESKKKKWFIRIFVKYFITGELEGIGHFFFSFFINADII